MKKIILLIMSACIASIGLISCEDELDVNSKLNFPPTIIAVNPKSSVKIGDFDIKVFLADGPTSPLSSATVTLFDANGVVLHTVTEQLSGVEDSVVIDGTAFNAANLPLGNYSLTIEASDIRGNTTELDQPFKIANQLYAANQAEMYIAGAFNGWGSGVMELVGDNMWEIKNVDLQGGPFKFKNRTDWSDTDWGDSNCDKIMEITTGGGPNTECAYTGLVHITFNDETLKYTVSPAVTYATNLVGLYLLGSINDYEGTQPKFNLIADYTWEIEEVRLKPGDRFKFAESPYFEGKNYGGTGMSGKAVLYGPSFVFEGADAYYRIVFNDQTRAFEFQFARAAYELFLVGGGTEAGWNPPNSLPFKTIGDKKYEIFANITAGGGFKFLVVQDWAGDLGEDPNNPGKIIQEGEQNVDVAESGFYRITVDRNANTYEAVKLSWGIIGDATPGGWGADTDMTFVSGSKWQIDITLSATGKFKFRANDDWAINFGKGAAAGSLEYGGGDIDTPGAGTYRIVMDLDAVNGYTYSVTQL